MNIKELKYIADIEMMREQHLSKGMRLEIARAAREGHTFTIEMSTDDYINITSNLRRKGFTNMTGAKSETANRKVMTFNPSK